MRGARSAGSAAGWVREPAVAGQFYAGRADRLASEVDRHLAAARTAMPRAVASARRRLVAVIAPHAGHVYSGATAGYAYASIDPASVRRVVLLGPAHYVPVDGIGLTTAAAWRTPLGDITIDADVGADLRAHFDDVVAAADGAHAPEHSLEVQLPFLQRVLDEGWALVPLIVGADLPSELAAIVARCAALPQTLVVVSTDLSHYLDYESALVRDAGTIAAVCGRHAGGIGPHDACGRYPLRGLLTSAAAADWQVELLDARNSGDTAGGRDRVVGYAAFAVWNHDTANDRNTDAQDPAEVPDPLRERPESATSARLAPISGRILPDERTALLGLARRTIAEALDTGRRPRFDPSGWSDSLCQPGAAFVTLRSRDGDLLGCIGSLSARQSLVADVAEHAYDAAFRDPRFPPMTPDRANGMVVDISVLSTPQPFPCAGYADLLARVPVGSGVVVTAGRRRATFLPAVWSELPEPGVFLAALWRKAGLAPGEWPRGTAIETYESEEFAEA